MHRRGIHNKLVIGAAAGILAGLYHQRTGVAQRALAADNSLFSQRAHGQIAVNSLRIGNAQVFQIQTHGAPSNVFCRDGVLGAA